MQNIAIIEKIIGYTFSDKSLLQLAFTHPSFSEHNYQRLEFLGDSILGAVVSEYLYENYPEYDEGLLTLIRSNVVDKPPLKKVIVSLGLNQYLLLGKGEKVSHLEKDDKPCGDLYESIVGAMFLDSGYEVCKKYIIETLEDTIYDVVKNKDELVDFKSQVIQYCQKHKLDFEFPFMQEGEAHSPIFTVSLLVDGKELGKAKGTSKKKAEQAASRIAIKKLNIIK